MSIGSQRRGAIDVARVGALALVVAGHLAMAVIDRGPDGALRGVNAFVLHPGLAWSAMLAPMPVFFAAAGWANATSTPERAAARLRPLVGLAAVVVLAWSAAAAIEVIVSGHGGLVADGARVATQPLWFVAAYAPFTAAGSVMARLARRPWPAVTMCLVLLAALDLARFRWGAADAIGWPGFWLAWGVPWLLGAAWRQRATEHPDRHCEVCAGFALAAGATTAAVILVVAGGYFPALIDAVAGERSNTTPPTLFTAVAGVAQVGLLVAAAGPLDRLALRWRSVLNLAGEAAVAVYAWHLTALGLCAGLLAAGLWTPPRFGATWWITRPAWWALVLGVTAVLVAITSFLRARPPEGRATVPGRTRIVVAVVLATSGAAVAGRWGPRTPATAAAAIIGLVGASWALRPPERGRSSLGSRPR